jgi:hypothetical protein
MNILHNSLFLILNSKLQRFNVFPTKKAYQPVYSFFQEKQVPWPPQTRGFVIGDSSYK